MGCFPSKDSDALVYSLQAQVRSLQQQLGTGGQGGWTDVLFFPDPALPCRHGNNCRRQNCTYAHMQTSLTKLLSVLGSARTSILVCVFTITCDDIADALLQAHRRGVHVRVITDNDQAKTQGSDIGKFVAAGIPVKMDADQFHMHHKFAVVDSRLVCNGSFNWTRQAVLNNQENCVITDSPALVRAFTAQFEALWRKYK